MLKDELHLRNITEIGYETILILNHIKLVNAVSFIGNEEVEAMVRDILEIHAGPKDILARGNTRIASTYGIICTAHSTVRINVSRIEEGTGSLPQSPNLEDEICLSTSISNKVFHCCFICGYL